MNNKQKKKELRKLYKQREANDFQKSLSIPVELLRGLFNFLNAQVIDEIEPRFRLTEQFCVENGINFEKLKVGPIENGAGDDAEVIWNIEEKFEEI